MAGLHKKGTTDADANGKMGGSLPEKVEAGNDKRLAALEAEVAALRALMKANGWSV